MRKLFSLLLLLSAFTVFGQHQILQGRSDAFVFGNNYSLEFDGVDEYATAGDHYQYSFGNGGTDSAFSGVVFMNRDTSIAGVINILISKGNVNNTSMEYFFYLNGASLVIYTTNTAGGGLIGRSAPMATIKSWIGVAFTYDGSKTVGGFKLYSLSGGTVTRIDNANFSAGTYNGMTNTVGELFFGKRFTAGINFFNGKLYAPQIYDIELTSTQLDEIADNPSKDASTYSFGANLVTAWHFPDGQANYPNWIGYGTAVFDATLQNMMGSNIISSKP